MLFFLTLNKIEGDKAYLTDQNNQEFIWPKTKIPENNNIGDKLTIYVDDKETSDGKNLAKHIINEFLNLNNEESNSKTNK